MRRRTFLGVISAGAAGVLTGGLPKLLAAASASKSEETFLLGGDLLVNRLGFGAMRLTGEGIWGWPPDRENAKKVLRRALELGVNFIDTADAYGPETNELLIAEALYPYPKGLVIATKGGNTRPGPGQWVQDGRPEYLTQAVEKGRADCQHPEPIQYHRPRVGSRAQLLRERKDGIHSVGADRWERGPFIEQGGQRVGSRSEAPKCQCRATRARVVAAKITGHVADP